MMEILLWELKVPTTRLYGKDDPNGDNQLPVTTQVDLRLQVNGEIFTTRQYPRVPTTYQCQALSSLMGRGNFSELFLSLIPILVLHRFHW